VSGQCSPCLPPDAYPFFLLFNNLSPITFDFHSYLSVNVTLDMSSRYWTGDNQDDDEDYSDSMYVNMAQLYPEYIHAYFATYSSNTSSAKIIDPRSYMPEAHIGGEDVISSLNYLTWADLLDPSHVVRQLWSTWPTSTERDSLVKISHDLKIKIGR